MTIETGPAAPALVFEGISNFRSLGGLRSRDGRRIRTHCLMRSERLHDLSPADWRQMAGTGLTTVCDLRSELERVAHPNRPPPELRLLERNFDVRNDLRGDSAFLEMLAQNATLEGAERVMLEIYRGFPEKMAASMRGLCELLLADPGPMLIHCTAGKDRTGFAVALLLHALDIPREAIYEDYLISRTWPGARAHRASMARRLANVVPPAAMDDVLDSVLGVREGYLDAAFAAIVAESGSVDRYLEQVAGLDAASRDRLRERLLI